MKKIIFLLFFIYLFSLNIYAQPPTIYNLGQFQIQTIDNNYNTIYIAVDVIFTYQDNVRMLAVELPEISYILKDEIYSIFAEYQTEPFMNNMKEVKERIRKSVNDNLRSGEIKDVLFDNITYF
ncbi:hypothetical protein [uncultured Brachyspira sp.]|uniref:hypothetical protein n=1 Tax=uncultured Brachyspira sp. TaxID=221953 RepID=UPI002601E826|nr:hypothetical protein [uncultured Brachyspira sp.]